MKFIEFKVTGRGTFPWDMLRYDACWPVTGDDAAKLTDLDDRTITLRTYNKSVTVERWRSFLWGCEVMS